MTPTLEELHARIMQIEQYLMDKEPDGEKSNVPWFDEQRVNFINEKWTVTK